MEVIKVIQEKKEVDIGFVTLIKNMFGFGKKNTDDTNDN